MESGSFTIRRSTRASRLGAIGAVVLLAAAATLPWWSDSATMRLLTEFACYLVLAQMWNLLAGYGGLMSVGQQGYLGIGGYALFVLADYGGLDPFLCVLLGGLIAAAVSVPTAALVFRLQGGHFAIGTWVVAEVFRLAASNSAALGGGSGRSLQAMREIPRSLREPVTYGIAVAVAAASVAAVYLLMRSRFGLALAALRDSEPAAESQGVNVRRTKLWVYLVSAFGCGVAGALYFLGTLRISPDAAFNVGWSAAIIFIVVIGGIGTIEGPIIGTVVYFLLRETLSDYGTWYLIALGLVAIATMMKYPKGAWGTLAERFDLYLFPVQRRVERSSQMKKRALLWVDNPEPYREALEAAGLAERLDIVSCARGDVPPPEVVQDVEFMLAWQAPPGFLAGMPKLLWIQTPNTGVGDWLWRDDLRASIVMTCGRGIHRVQMPENILGALFHITKNYWDYVLRQRDKRWGRHLSEPLAGKTLGILGLGTIGGELARKAAALEMRVIGTKRDPVPLAHVDQVYGPEGTDHVLAQSDYVVLLLSLTPATENLIDTGRLRAMKRDAWLLNFARGALVVDEDLIEAVRSNIIAGAVLDVFRKEPLPPDHPFWTTERILVLPHIGGGHPRRDAIVAELFADNVRRYLAGERLASLVDRIKGY